jgi:glycosyltransferase involved in cell wall biosynthesis
LKLLVKQAGLESRILMLGHRNDLGHIYSNVDVLCFPSHYNAPGRPIFEAAYFGRPSIAAIDNPLSDTFVNGVTGISINAKDPVSLENAIEWMVENPAKRNEMGRRAYELALKNFDLKSNVEKLLLVYDVYASEY